MATVPSFDTFNAGELVTAAKLNKNVRDAGNFLKATPMVHLQSTTPQSLGNAATVRLQFQTTVLDTDNMADLTNNRIVFKTAGYYHLTGQVGCVKVGAVGAWHDVWGFFRLGGTTYLNDASSGTARIAPSVNLNLLSYFSVGQTVELWTYQANSGSLAADTQTSYGGIFMQARWVSS